MNDKTMTFELPNSLNAIMPPERRGLRRDQVKLMVLDKETGQTTHDNFYNLGSYLKKGDLVVLNSSRTIPAKLEAVLHKKGILESESIELHLARQLTSNVWEALPLLNELRPDDLLIFSEDLNALVKSNTKEPFVRLQFSKSGINLLNEIYKIGQPIRYEYILEPWELDYYQTVYATTPGSVEMPSAGRAFSWEMIFELKKCGIETAFLQLHTGLSYLMDDKWSVLPCDNYERFLIPDETVNTIMKTKANGGRVIAVGTTVVRALESGFDSSQKVNFQSGWTNLYINAETSLKIADGLITGFHEPEASHLDLLSAFVRQDYLFKAYQKAIEKEYLWHEFGDINLIM